MEPMFSLGNLTIRELAPARRDGGTKGRPVSPLGTFTVWRRPRSKSCFGWRCCEWGELQENETLKLLRGKGLGEEISCRWYSRWRKEQVLMRNGIHVHMIKIDYAVGNLRSYWSCGPQIKMADVIPTIPGYSAAGRPLMWPTLVQTLASTHFDWLTLEVRHSRVWTRLFWFVISNFL